MTLDTGVLNCSFAVVRHVLAKALKMCRRHLREPLRELWELRKAVPCQQLDGSCRIFLSNKIHECVTDIPVCRAIHGHIDEVEMPFEAQHVELVDQHVPRVTIWNVSQHERGHALLPLLGATPEALRQLMNSFKVDGLIKALTRQL